MTYIYEMPPGVYDDLPRDIHGYPLDVMVDEMGKPVIDDRP